MAGVPLGKLQFQETRGSPTPGTELSANKVVFPKQTVFTEKAACGKPFTLTGFIIVSAHPDCAVTINVAVNDPAGYVTVGFCEVEDVGLPPGKLQFHVAIGVPFEV